MFIFGNTYKLQQWCIHNGKNVFQVVFRRNFRHIYRQYTLPVIPVNGSNIFIKIIVFEGRVVFFLFVKSYVQLLYNSSYVKKKNYSFGGSFSLLVVTYITLIYKVVQYVFKFLSCRESLRQPF